MPKAATVGSGKQYSAGAAIDRREFCCSAIAVTVSLGSLSASAAARTMASASASLALYKVIFDIRFAASCAFGAAAARTGVNTAAINGDVTALWLQDLGPHWAAGGGAVAGMTTPRTLLCLEQLAHDTWRRVLSRSESGAMRSSAHEARLVSWLIGI